VTFKQDIIGQHAVGCSGTGPSLRSSNVAAESSASRGLASGAPTGARVSTLPLRRVDFDQGIGLYVGDPDKRVKPASAGAPVQPEAR